MMPDQMNSPTLGVSCLVIMCVDERSESMTTGQVPPIRVPGGVLLPQCMGVMESACDDMLVRMVELAIAVKRPKVIQIVTHAHCGVQEMLKLSDEQVRESVRAFTARLRSAGIDLPVVAVHDDHCLMGKTRKHRLYFRTCDAVAA
jgi:carbonic anhydrase